MTRTRHMQSPIPRTPHIHRLRIETVVPVLDTQLQAPLHIDWQVNSPGAPRIFVLLGEALRVDVGPDVVAVGRDLNTFRPVPVTTVGPSFDADVAVVNDDFFSSELHNRRGDEHFLNLDPLCVFLVVFANLACAIEIFAGCRTSLILPSRRERRRRSS